MMDDDFNGDAALFSDEELCEIRGVKRGVDFVEVMCGCTSRRYVTSSGGSGCSPPATWRSVASAPPAVTKASLDLRGHEEIIYSEAGGMMDFEEDRIWPKRLMDAKLQN